MRTALSFLFAVFVLVLCLLFQGNAFGQLNCSGGCSTGGGGITPVAINTGVTSILPFGPAFQFTDPTAPAFAWQNQGTATVANLGTTTTLVAQGAGGASVHSRLIAAPATPYTVDAAFLVTFNPALVATDGEAGLIFRESGTSKLVMCAATNGAFGIELQWLKYTNDTTFSANYNAQVGSWMGAILWLRITDNGTNISCQWSADGNTFFGFPVQTRGSFFTTGPNQIGFSIDDEGAVPIALNILSWNVH